MSQGFLPVTKEEIEERGWDAPDFIYVCGDAYVDDPSFGQAIISRVLEAHGYKVAMMPQPDYKNPESILALGEPKLGFLVSAGNMDSMVNHYTVSKHKRKMDNYSPGGVMGIRPDYATIVYCNMIRRYFKHSPIIIGGIEASLRRLGHYDYWSDKIRRSILLDSGADIISYGMGEKSIVEIADALASGIDVKDISFIRGTVFKTRDAYLAEDAIQLPAFEDVKADKMAYARSFAVQYRNTDPFVAKKMCETYDGSLYVIQNPPAFPLSQMEMDDVYALPYMRAYHPMYEKDGGIPAIKEIKFSLTSNRGCFGGCNFCALTFHEGRIVQTRSHESIIDEAKIMIEDKDFKGYIHDVGGPTADFRRPSCDKQMTKGVCPHQQCLFPEPCKNLKVDHKDYVSLLRKLRALPKVKKVFIRSGIRYDYVLVDRDDNFMTEVSKYHISGQLRVAPEHISDNVLKRMGKPGLNVYSKFVKKFYDINTRIGKEQYLVPYLMSSHPGSRMEDAIELAEYIRDLGYMPEQVSDFYPTPSTISTVMYYTGVDPETMEEVYVPKNPHEKAMQRALIQYRDPKNYDLVKEALHKAHREDLIGTDENCLIPPRKGMRMQYKAGLNGEIQSKLKKESSSSVGKTNRHGDRKQDRRNSNKSKSYDERNPKGRNHKNGPWEDENPRSKKDRNKKDSSRDVRRSGGREHLSKQSSNKGNRGGRKKR